ncbi:MAG: ferrochelatase [Candidatus Accumulibacter sp.]|jgi:ferrochelatase|nr:ferrochelatase [Accumulibacter sp.]
MPPPSSVPSPAPRSGETGRTAVLLISLGTPDAPTAPAIRRYLLELLSDPRVVQIPRILWWPILHGIVLKLRPRKLAARYAAIWTAEGSPLKWHTEMQAKLLHGFFGQSGHSVRVDYAMRYGQPSIPEVLSRLAAEGCTGILLLPLYPQHSASTTTSAFAAAFRWAGSVRKRPELRMVRGFAREPEYVAALAASVRRHWAAHGRPESSYRLVMSFHGMPAKAVERGDPYHDECLLTGRLLARVLNLDDEACAVSFQSRFGFTRWLRPYTAELLENLGRQKIRRVDVLCPGFPSDCLETLEEIAVVGKSLFLTAGGQEFFPIPCLNENEDWIRALKTLALRHLQGWPTR